MKKRSSYYPSSLIILMVGLFSSVPSVAVTPQQEYELRVRDNKGGQGVIDGAFGEKVSLYSGSLMFQQTDIEQPGIGLPIQLIRTYDVKDLKPQNEPARALSDWRLEVPHIETLFEAFTEQTDYVGTFFSGNRCTNFKKAPAISMNTGPTTRVTYTPEDWWGGYQLVIPGLENQDLMLRDSSNNLTPQMAGGGGLRSFPIVSNQQWMVSCLASTSNGLSGEGFLVVSPQGIKYWMDWLIYRPYPELNFAQGGPQVMRRKTAMMMVSRIEDRFGNSLTYQYDSAGNLAKIQASDGRVLTLAYETWTNSNNSSSGSRLSSATLQASDATPRTWRYSYLVGGDSRSRLVNVTQPDNSSWAIDFSGFQNWSGSPSTVGSGCVPSLVNGNGTKSGTIRHPSGMSATFVIGSILRGRSYVNYKCEAPDSSTAAGLRNFNIYSANAILSKRIYGPAMQEKIWTYRYSAPGNSWAKDCSPACTTNVWTELTEPGGVTSRYTFSNRFDYSEGQLLRFETYAAGVGSQMLKDEYYQYASSSLGSWPTKLGNGFLDTLNDQMLSTLSPLQKRRIFQDSVEYTTEMADFDAFARPTKISSYSPWYRRDDKIEYLDNFAKWILGSVSALSNINTGKVSERKTFDSNSMPLQAWTFGKLSSTSSYNADGTLASIKDGRGNTTNYSNWKRSTPGLVSYADGTALSRQVNDYGWITSVTDQNRNTTYYEYDAMGRIAKQQYPNGDSVLWNQAVTETAFINTSEYEVPPGHWRTVTSIGNSRKITYFDGALRPILTREYDAANEPGTQRFQRFSYDHKGRSTFISYVGEVPNIEKGFSIQYDGLGRESSLSQNSELGLLRTTTEYLPQGQKRVTNPQGQSTLTGYQVFGQPSYDDLVWVQRPEGATTEITRDVFGKTLSISARDQSGSVTSIRRYVYHPEYQTLCKVVEPETGATVLNYDEAGNLTLSAGGLELQSASECNLAEATASGRSVTRLYDKLNRLSAIDFPGGNGNQSIRYWPGGLVRQVDTLNDGVVSYNNYSYNKRNQLINEVQAQADGEAFSMAYAYDANGHLERNRYPSGQTVDYSPNALGQPTQVGPYARDVSYYPNGAIKRFIYGNGIVHSMVQNDRQLPDISRDSSDVDLTHYGYDYYLNGNVAAISDGAAGNSQRGNLTMTYDYLDRLTSVSSPIYGIAKYSYDALDNLIHVEARGRNQFFCYDPRWRLTNVKIDGCNGGTVVGMAYDAQGNLINKNGQAFRFDLGNRMREAVAKESYRYDANGRRSLISRSAGNIQTFYDRSGYLRFRKDGSNFKTVDYIYMGNSLVAEAEWAFGSSPSAKDYLSWQPTPGIKEYVVEESIDGVVWTLVYKGSASSWASLSRPSGKYFYRVSACSDESNCTAVSSLTHSQRSSASIVPVLYQLLLN
ncbi:RHS repeat domain-containing protein [Xanthomonas arboricola]|uniref:RHS repeat domain-containing protein n=1 Tax=Xanthomonas arboricola TaxID=56448 RepID=UPI002157E390|nr:hypothetical protein [Xanthomonas arboricola]